MRALRRSISILPLPAILILLTLAVLLTACIGADEETSQELRTWLLVGVPEAPLRVNQQVNVRSRTVDPGSRISHVELYAVELPGGHENVLIRADRAPFDQTSFTASQVFIPTQAGHYVIKVVGYNRQGERVESDYLGFDVE